jgi:hypothetical protein
MGREFQNIKPDGSWSNHKSLDETIVAARKQMPSGLKPYILKKDGKIIRRGPRAWVLAGLERALKKGKVGPTYRVWGGGEVLFTCKETVAAIHIIDTNGNDKADRAWSWAKFQFPDISFLGAYVCKHIVGSYTMSQHSYGNAVDFGRDSMDELYDLAYYLVAHADELDLQHVIVDDRIWTRGFGWSHYGGDRHYHVHCDFTPQYSGSCGVRG